MSDSMVLAQRASLFNFVREVITTTTRNAIQREDRLITETTKIEKRHMDLVASRVVFQFHRFGHNSIFMDSRCSRVLSDNPFGEKRSCAQFPRFPYVPTGYCIGTDIIRSSWILAQRDDRDMSARTKLSDDARTIDFRVSHISFLRKGYQRVFTLSESSRILSDNTLSEISLGAQKPRFPQRHRSVFQEPVISPSLQISSVRASAAITEQRKLG